MDCAVGIDGIGPWSGVCDVDRSGCARKPRESARAPLGGGCFRPSFRVGPRGMGSCGGMREWAHRLWSSSVNSGAMTSQSTSAEHDRNTSGRAAIVLATSARSDARVDMGIKVSSTLRAHSLLGNPGFVNGAVSGLGRGRGRCAVAWVGSRARFDPRASPGIRRSARRCRRLGSQRGAACSPRPISDLLIQQTFILARSERGLRPIHLARRVDPDTTPRTSIADVVPDRARALGVDQGAGLHRPPGRRPRAWWTRRHRVSARRA